MQFEQLMTRLTDAHQALQHHARKTVDTTLILRNRLFGYYLVESEGDQPPIGILLCTSRDDEHVELATAGLDNRIFVSKYKVALPSEAELKAFLVRERETWESTDAKS